MEGALEHINKLPLEDMPEIFGLHPNADLTFSFNNVRTFVDTLILVNPKSGGGAKGGQSLDELVEIQVNSFKSQLRKPYNLHFDPESASSLHVFRKQEVDNFNILIKTMHQSFDDLILALHGKIVMSLALDQMRMAISLKRVPPNWQAKAYLTLKPLGSWYEDLKERLDFFQKWIEEDYLPSYWVSSFYFPQGFMTAVLQTYARKTQIPIDKLMFKTTVLKIKGSECVDVPEDGTNIHG